MIKKQQSIKLQVAGYARVSSEDQELKNSIEAQVDYLKAYCIRESWELVQIYQDNGISGATMERPGLSRLMQDAAKHKFRAVLVYHNDRLSRDVGDAVAIGKSLQALGISLRCGNIGGVDLSTPAGNMIYQQLAVFAEYFRRDLGLKTSLGMQKRSRAGQHMGRAGDMFMINDKGELRPRAEYLPLIKRALQLHDQGFSLSRIAAELKISNPVKVMRLLKTCKRLNIKNTQSVL